MSKMMNFSGKQLQRAYSNPLEGLPTESQRAQHNKDVEAMLKVNNARRERRLARMEARDKNHINPHKELEVLESNPLEIEEVKKVVDKAKSQTNAIAREYGLPEPNNPEALAHDRLHCWACNRKLHSPNAHKQAELDTIFDDSEVRILCCWCFGRFGEEQMKTTMKSDKDATKQIRLAVYDPEEFCKEEIAYLTDMKRIQIKSKIKQYDAILVGKVKHDVLEDGDWMENCVIYNAKTRWTACSTM